MAIEAGQSELDIVFDQAIYAKALEIIWARGQEFENCVIRLGGFHTLCAFFNVIGKRFQDAGLADILVECKIIADGSIAGVMNGHQYNRAVRCHKIMFEALQRVRFISFGKWLVKQDNVDLDIVAVYHEITEAQKQTDKNKVEEILESPLIGKLFEEYEKFIQLPRGPMDEFWDSYLDMSGLALAFLRSIRKGDLKLNIHCGVLMWKWMGAYDALHYFRCFPVHLYTLMNLKNTHPEVYDQLGKQGQFGVQRSNGNAFGKVAEDMSIEQTLNKGSKSQGGIIGFSLKRDAVERWVTTAPERIAITDNFKRMAGIVQNDEVGHKEATKSRIAKDEKAVRAVMNKLLNEVINPFECQSTELVSLTSGIVATKQVQDDLLRAENVGLENCKEFASKRLLSLDVPYHDPIKKCSLGSFSTLTSTKQKKTSDEKTVIIKADRGLFARLMVIAQRRNIDFDIILQHELGPLPWSLSTVFGTLQTTTKSAMLNAILDIACPLIPQIPSNSALVIDFMALIQTYTNPETFGKLAEKILRDVTSSTVKRIDLVCDRYFDISIKNFERQKRATSGVLATKIVGPDQSVQQWSKFLKLGSNKEALVNFLFEEWEKPEYAPIIDNHKLMVTHLGECHIFTQARGKVRKILVPDLCTGQEEADTRMFLHAAHCATSGFNAVVIRTEDSDVISLSLYIQLRLTNTKLIIERHAGGKHQLIDIEALCRILGKEVCNALPGYHAVTGCDSVSAFFGRGKKIGLGIIRTNEEMRSTMSDLGNNREIDPCLLSRLFTFVCYLYGYDSNNINDVRVDMFTTPMAKKKPPPESQYLPPTADALEKHLKRANYQSYIWKHALEADPVLPSLNKSGWIKTQDKLEIDWMENEPAPVAVLELISCGCKTDCSSKRCTCNKSGLACTDACNCSNDCANTRNDDQNNLDEDEEESEPETSDNETSESSGSDESDME